MSKMPWIRFFPSDWLAGTRGMSAVETGVYITLIATMYERGEPIPEDHARLARLCGASNSSFAKAIETLVVEGKIVRVEGGLWNDRVEKEQVYLSEKSEVARRAGKISAEKRKQNQGEDATDVQPAFNERSTNQKPEARSQKISSSLRSEETIEHEFENHFWPVYPRKAGKGQALKAYRAARKRAELDVILEGVRRYASERSGEDPNFTRHGATWLNGQGWLDEPTSRAPPQSRSAPPRQASPSMQRHHEIHSRLKRELYGEPDDEFTGQTVDLAAGDFRSH